MHSLCWTVAVLTVCALLLKADKIRYKVTNRNKCFKPQVSFVQFIGVSIQECVNACVKRHTCQSVAYRTRMNLCELHKDDIGTLVTHPDDISCVFIRREDMETNAAATCNCTHVGHVCNLGTGQCEISECGKLELLNGQVYGNVYDIGAQLKVTCLPGYAEPRGVKQVTCNITGDWDPTPTCEAAGIPKTIASTTITVTTVTTTAAITAAATTATTLNMQAGHGHHHGH